MKLKIEIESEVDGDVETFEQLKEKATLKINRSILWIANRITAVDEQGTEKVLKTVAIKSKIT